MVKLSDLAIIMLIASVATGCATMDPPGAEPGSETSADGHVPPARLRWSMTGCREIIATFNVDTAALQAVLPVGFEARPSRIVGQSGVGIDIFECEFADATSGPMLGASYASFWAGVNAPDGLMGNATDAYVKWDTMVQDPEALHALRSVNAHVRGGYATVRELNTLGGTVGHVKFDDLGPLTITTLPTLSDPTAAGEASTLLREWSPTGEAGEALVMWEVTLVQKQAALAPGTIEVPVDSMAAKLYGSTRIPALVNLGMAELRDGFIEIGSPVPGAARGDE